MNGIFNMIIQLIKCYTRLFCVLIRTGDSERTVREKERKSHAAEAMHDFMCAALGGIRYQITF